MGSLEAFQEQFHKLKEVEVGKDQLIEVSCLVGLFPAPDINNRGFEWQKLFIRINELESGLTDTKLHLEREQDTAKLYQSKLSGVQVDLRKLDERIVGLSKLLWRDRLIKCV